MPAMQLDLFSETHEPDWSALRRCAAADLIALDIETDTRWPGSGPNQDYGLSYPAEVTVIGLAWAEDGRIQTTALAAPFDEAVRAYLVDRFRSETRFIAHNAVFDFRQLSKLTDGWVPRNIWDTYSMARLLNPGIDARYSLTGVAESMHLEIPDAQRAMKGQRAKLHLIPTETKMTYVQDDARLAYEIYRRQQRLKQDPHLVEWECRAVYEYCVMAARGIRLNAPYVASHLKELIERRDEYIERLTLDGLPSPRDSKARAKYLYITKGIPLPRWPEQRRFFTWGGRRRMRENPGTEVTFSDLSTNQHVINAYLEEEPEFADALRDLAGFQEVDWLVSALEGLEKHAVADGRLHSLVSIGTDTGRRASSHPHMQNWKMPEMAGVAIGDEGFTLVEIDYRNAENIMAALISVDSNLSAACQTEDFHSTMAVEYFGDDWANADSEGRKKLRGWSKRITYGTNYGMGAAALGRSLRIPEEEARALMEAKDRAFPNVTRTRAQAKKQARDTNKLHLWTGRPIAVPSAFVAWNYLCQGGVSEIVKRAIVRTNEAYRKREMRSRVALDMHDALIIEVAHDEWERAINIATYVMQTTVPAELNNRTQPPIQWFADPDLKENRSKWGAQQWHPPVTTANVT